MSSWRAKPDILGSVTTITADQHEELIKKGSLDKEYWDFKDEPDKTLIASFRSEVKRHYYLRQARRCCYCSKELDHGLGSFHAEHILDKSTYPQFTFHTENLAASCGTCNTKKGIKVVLADPGAPLTAVPEDSESYTIVHPHHDEWSDFFEFDQIGRIVGKPISLKGAVTIETCGIYSLNAARLSDYFLPGDSAAAQLALEKIFTLKSQAWIQKKFEILDKIAKQYNLSRAVVIIDVLKEEIERRAKLKKEP